MEDFNMSSRYEAMAFSVRKLLKSIFVHFKSRVIVHGRDNNSLSPNSRELKKINKSIDIPKTPYRLITNERTLMSEESEESIAEMLNGAMGELYGSNPELAVRVHEELNAAATGEENILLVGTDGQYSITILHVDPDFIPESQRIVLLPSSSDIAILAAVSRKFIEENILRCEMHEDVSSKSEADEMWDTFMGSLLKEAVELHEKNPNTL